MTRIKLKYCYSFVDSTGKVRYVVRRKGKSVTIKGEPGSAQFMAAYQAALDPTAKPPSTKGTLGALAKDFYGSPKFSNLKPNSKTIYETVIKIVAQRIGSLPLKSMPVKAANMIVSEIARDRGPAMANVAISVMNRVFSFAIKNEIVNNNPFRHAERYKTGKHHTWTDREIAIYESRWPIGTRERLTMAVLLYTGQRGGDCVRIRRSDIQGGVIRLTQEKTDKPMVISVHPELERIIRATPAKGVYLIGDRVGRPMTQGGLLKMIKRAGKAAGLPPSCVPHGLRKAILTQLANLGASNKELKAVSGHKTDREVNRYTEMADQARLNKAALARLKKEE